MRGIEIDLLERKSTSLERERERGLGSEIGLLSNLIVCIRNFQNFKFQRPLKSFELSSVEIKPAFSTNFRTIIVRLNRMLRRMED